MDYINPIEILKLTNESVDLIDSSTIRKAKRKLFAEIDLSDDGVINYYDQKLTKSACEKVINELEDSKKLLFYYHLSKDDLINSFLADRKNLYLTTNKLGGNYKHTEFIDFISPYFSYKFDSVLLKAFRKQDIVLFSSLLQASFLIAPKDINNAYRSLSNEIEKRIDETNKLASEIKEGESIFTDDNIETVLNIIVEKFPLELLNRLPLYFQSQINKIATSLNYLQLNIWNEFGATIVSLNILEHLLSLNIESIKKPIFEKNYEIVKNAFNKTKEEKKIQAHVEKLLALIHNFENKESFIEDARQLICQSKQYLFNLKSLLKENDNSYLSLSNRVASLALNIIIDAINTISEQDSVIGEWRMRRKLKDAWGVVQLIGSIDMKNDFFINRYKPNKEKLKDICEQFNVSTTLLTIDKLPKCNFIILEGIITHTDKDSKQLPITNPFLRGDVRYIGLNLKVEAFDNQFVKFRLRYIQPDGKIKRVNNSDEDFSFTIDKTLTTSSNSLYLSGLGNNEDGIFEVGKHVIEVWIGNSLIYQISFVVDLSQFEKNENARREAEKLEQKKLEAEKIKEQKRINEQKERDNKVRKICMWIMGISIGLAIIFTFWGTSGILTFLTLIGIIAGVLAISYLLAWFRTY